MDLPYPSIKDCQLNHPLKSNRKRSIVIKDSFHLIPRALPLPNSIKNKIIKLIEQDSSFELKQLVQKQAINFYAQIGGEGVQQNMLHKVCSENAPKCLEYMAKTQYMYFPSEFEEWLNRRTKQGLTPIMICALHSSNECLSMLLNIGRVDIHMIDSNKLSAYQMALNNKNQLAVKMLMDYENGLKKGKSLNTEYLSEEIKYSKAKMGLCESVYSYIVDCLLCGGYLQEQEINNKIKNKKKSPSLLQIKLDNLFTDLMDQVDIGYTSDQLGACQIEWKMLGEYQQKGKTGVLFQNFSPYDVEDINIPMPHFLIVFQSLSQHTSLLRRLIQAQKSKAGLYNISLYQNNILKVISTDSYLPFVSKTMQPAFIADKKEGWPMILQKSLAKLFGNYKKLQKLSIKDLMQAVTGWPVINLQLSKTQNIYDRLKKYFETQKYMFVLQGKANSMLSPKDGSVTCFTVLNFYEKGGKRMILINCPFVDAEWMQKERFQSKALKVLRGHFNCRGQMTIWIEQERLQEYFNNVQIAPVRSGFQRQQIQISVDEAIYFRLQALSADEPTVMYIIDHQTGKMMSSVEWQGRNDQNEVVEMLADEFSKEGFGKFQSKEGEYLFKVKVPKGKYLLIVWSQEQTKIEPIEQDFGHLQLLDCAKRNEMKTWNDSKPFIVKDVNNSYLIMTKSQSHKKYVCIKGTFEVFQGKRRDGQSIEMINDGQFGYIVLVGRIQGDPTFYEET